VPLFGRRPFLLALAAICFATAGAARADDECRPPTPQEKQAAEKLAAALKTSVIAPLLAQGWTVDHSDTAFDSLTVAVKPAPPRPIMTCAGAFDLQLRLSLDSPRGKEIRRQAEAFSKENTTEGSLKMFHVLALGQLEIKTNENDPFVSVPLRNVTHLEVRGAPLAYRTISPPASSADEPTVTTTVCVGDWTKFETDKYAPYPFSHRPGTPFIENACVSFIAPVEVVDPILKTIDWRPVSDALTK
jgi:hypothetical protein